MSRSEVRVTVSRNGPYLVAGGPPLATQTIVADDEGGSQAWADGEVLETKAQYALCRCGASRTKPFCDGSHLKTGFDGTETAEREPYLERAMQFDGPAMVLTDAESLCAFGRFCDPNGQVWSQVERTSDPAVRRQFTEQVGRCPAGRLVAWDKAARTPVEPELPVSIGLVEDPAQGCSGPLWLRGGIAVVSADGFAYETRNRVTLCRCGASRNKPFCDGTHAAIKFDGR